MPADANRPVPRTAAGPPAADSQNNLIAFPRSRQMAQQDVLIGKTRTRAASAVIGTSS